MLERTTRPVARRVLIVDDELAQPTTRGRSRRPGVGGGAARAASTSSQPPPANGVATVVSDSAIHCVFVNWTLGSNGNGHGNGKGHGNSHNHVAATELLRTVRKRNAKVPIFLWPTARSSGTVTVEVATLADEFIWMLDDTATFISGRVQAAIERYVAGAAAAVHGGAGALRPRAANIPGPRPATRAASRSSSRRSAACSSTSTARTCSAPTWASSAARWARCSATAGRSARASATPRACSARTAPTRCSTARRRRTAPSCRPASATTRSRSAIATATSRSSRGWRSPAASRCS